MRHPRVAGSTRLLIKSVPPTSTGSLSCSNSLIRSCLQPWERSRHAQQRSSSRRIGPLWQEILSAASRQSWARAPLLQSLMTRSVRNSRAPIFFFQAENDYDLSPSRVLSAAMRDAGREFELKIYPPFGNSAEDGHTFGYFGSSVWVADGFRFLKKHCQT